MKPKPLLQGVSLVRDSKRQIGEWLAKSSARGGVSLLARLVLEAHEEDYGDLWGVFAAPSSPRKRGIGKSTLAIQLLLHVYRDWGVAKQYIVYHPAEFIRIFERLVDREERIPLLVWDDAGAWLFRGRFREKFVQAIVEHLEVIRTHVSNIFFTATSVGKLAKGVRESLGFIVLVSTAGTYSHGGRTWKKARARLYEVGEDLSWLFKRSKAPEALLEFYFTVKLPDPVYKDYVEMRKNYVRAGVEKVRRELEKLEEYAGELDEVASKSDGAEAWEP